MKSQEDVKRMLKLDIEKTLVRSGWRKAQPRSIWAQPVIREFAWRTSPAFFSPMWRPL